MDKKLILLAAKACQAAYKKNIDLGQAEYALTEVEYNGEPLQILAMPGSNEMSDWFWNMWVWSVDGVKSCTHKAVEAVHNKVLPKALLVQPPKTIDRRKQLLVTGHSKAGPDALHWKDKYGADYCVAFCPPPAFRKWNKPTLRNTTIVADHDDIVHNLGFISFDHPVLDEETSEWIWLPNDHKGFHIKDHLIDNIVEYFENLVMLEEDYAK